MLHWLHSLLPHIPHYGFVLVFIVVFLNNLGFPLPGETVLLGAGFVLGKTADSLWQPMLAGTVASFLGGICAFWLGQRLEYSRLAKIHWLRLTPKRLKWPDQLFKQHGTKSVFIARFIFVFPPVVVNLLAGMAKMRWRTFLFYNLTGSAAYSAAYILIGYFFGKKWKLLEVWLGPTALYLILAGIGLVIPSVIFRHLLFGFWRRLFLRKANENMINILSPPAPLRHVPPLAGLSSQEAAARLQKTGPNSMPDTSLHPLRRALTKFWAPVPWMLEAAMILEMVLGKYVEAVIIAVLLTFNAVLGFFQEGRAQATLAALKSRLALNAAVKRDNVWKTVPAAELVVGDVVKLSLGAVVAADVNLTGGEILLDQSMLTGESIPVEAGAGWQTYAGALVRRGEAVAEVTATGARTKFGRTAELVRTAHVVSTQQKAVLRVVRNLAVFNGVLIVILVAYALARGMPVGEIISLVLTAVLASIPVALPATFTLASALGARFLAGQGVLSTRLSAVDEAASMDVLCADKTGTLTLNQLAVTTVRPLPGYDQSQVLTMAALASSDGGQDTVDAAIRAAAGRITTVNPPKLLHFQPFDPATKMSEATATDPNFGTIRIVKGAFATVSQLAALSPETTPIANELELQGLRVLSVAAGPPAAMRVLGLIALSDPPREDSTALVTELKALGILTIMVTGDAPATAMIVAHAVGLTGAVCPPGPIPKDVRPENFAVFAGVLPEDKFKLVQAFQQANHIVGMCGDGANDAPALRQAQMGIAVSTATDVAKSAAGIVLTNPGLAGIVATVKEGRITFQRILTYTLNSVTKKVVQVLFLGAGLLMTGHAVLTPLLMIIVMMVGDLLGMSLTTDNVRPSPLPNNWHIGILTIAGIFMGLSELSFCAGVLAFGHFRLGLDLAALQTLAFVTLVCGNQATTYAVRARRRIWSSPHPSRWLVGSSLADVGIALTLAGCGWLMAPLPFRVLGGVVAGAVLFTFVLDSVKVPVFSRLKIS